MSLCFSVVISVPIESQVLAGAWYCHFYGPALDFPLYKYSPFVMGLRQSGIVSEIVSLLLISCNKEQEGGGWNFPAERIMKGKKAEAGESRADAEGTGTDCPGAEEGIELAVCGASA